MNGWVGLYDSSGFGDTSSIIGYATWGDGGGRLSVAIGAAAWTGKPISAPANGLAPTGNSGTAPGWGD